ncbi:MAG: ABC transporter substrate-binding protein [Oscillospiraceae bacterium]|nr:ABC transporter substrate-binding protein [Oscillospiraceae bacterium]
MKKIIKYIAPLLVWPVIISVFLCSCGADTANTANNPENEENKAHDAGDGGVENETAEIIAYEVPEMDCGGHNFRVVDRGGWVYWTTVDMYAEAETGEPINDAVYRRNRILEEKFNIEITEIQKEDVLGYVQKIIQSGSDDFDVLYPTMNNAAALIQKGLIVNLYDVPYLDFHKPWWDKVANDSMTISGKLYGAAGNITTTTNDATWCIMFNKDLNRDYGLEDPYKQVQDGKWTLDVLHSNCREVTKDINGDGALTPEDQWGAVNQHECAYCLFAASGQKVIGKGADDLPFIALNDDRSVSVVTKVIDFLSDGQAQVKADDYNGKYTNVWDEVNIKSFNESRALYYISPIESVKFMRNMEANFGILPLPKYDEAQPNYYNAFQYGNATVMCVPVSASDPERTGAILEAWAAESVQTLTKAYYEINLIGKYSRDDESEEMLDLIFSTRVIDQGIFFNWSGMLDFFVGFSQKKNVDFTSQYEKMEPKWTLAMEKTLEAIEENN